MALFSNKKEEKKEETVVKTDKALDTTNVLVKKPYITEKSTVLAEQGKYVFEVSKDANKIEIKKEIKNLYNVSAIKVNKIKSNPKKKGWGKNAGKKPGFVKAIVTLKKGQKIELLK